MAAVRETARSTAGPVALCVLVAALAGVSAAFGVFFRGGGRTAKVVSVRGEKYEMVTTGVYRYNSVRMVAEGVGWDVVTLFGAVPALLAALPFVARGSLRARLFAIGMLSYLFYQYLLYAVAWAFGPLFLLFVVTYAASLAAIVWLVSGIDIATLPARFSDAFPRRGVAGFSIAIGLLLVVMWLGRIASALGGETDGALLGQTTFVVQALDLGVIVPVALFTAALVLRRRALGFLLAPALMVKAVTMAAAICAMLIFAWRVEGVLEVVPFAIFACAGTASAWLGFVALGAVNEPV